MHGKRHENKFTFIHSHLGTQSSELYSAAPSLFRCATATARHCAHASLSGRRTHTACDIEVRAVRMRAREERRWRHAARAVRSETRRRVAVSCGCGCEWGVWVSERMVSEDKDEEREKL